MAPPRDRVRLAYLPCVVVGMAPASTQPHILVGASLQSPVGPAVAIGAALTIPAQGMSLALAGHLDPETARNLAKRILTAADEVEAALVELGRRAPSSEIKLPPHVILGAEGTPPSSQAVQGEDPDIFVLERPELMGVQCEIQHPLGGDKPRTEEPGMLGAGQFSAPDGIQRVLVQMNHPDGTSMGAMLQRETFASFAECLTEAGELAGFIPSAAKMGRAQ